MSKRKIENFYPVNCIKITSSKRNKPIYEPLFESYVFARISEAEIDQVKQLDYVMSLVFWRGHPAIVKDDEIDAIKDFITDHQNIKLVRTQVNVNDRVRIIDGPSYSLDGKVLSVKNKSIKVNLPSLGFAMVAEMEKESILGREISFGDKELSLQ